MITAGIDVGSLTVKAAIVDDERILGSSLLRVGSDRKQTAVEAFALAVRNADISQERIDRTVATGVGYLDVDFAKGSVTEIEADARGAAFFFPRARTVVDVGAEAARGVRLDGDGRIMDFAKNEKCAAGVGSFVESMARALEVKVEDMGPMSLRSDKEVTLNVTCVVFAESEVISLIHAQTPKEDIVRAIHDAIAARTTSMLRRVGIESEVVFLGGVARNVGAVEYLKKRLGMDISVPSDPQIVGAVGAALYART